MKAPPPKATIRSASSGPASGYSLRIVAKAACASEVSAATKWIARVTDSSSSQRHVAAQCGGCVMSVNDEVMTVWFTGNGALDHRVQQTVIQRGAQWRAKVRAVLLP